MKRCERCGARQSDTRVLCLDCGETLGGSLSQDEEERLERETAKKVTKMNNRADPLWISRMDKILGFGALGGIVGAIAFMVIGRHSPSLFPQAVYAILFFAFSFYMALFPRFMWEMEKLRLSFTIHNAELAEPSDLYLVMRRITIWAFFLLAVILLAIAIWMSYVPVDGNTVEVFLPDGLPDVYYTR